MEIREGDGVTGRRNRGVVPFLGASMAAGVSSLSSAGMALPAMVLKSEGIGEREREEGERVPLW